MSREMRDFSNHFMQGLALGAHWAEKWQAGQIAKERNKLKAQQDAMRNAREEKKLGLYAQSVGANAELAKARAYRALNPVARGGGSGSASTPADVTGLLKEANERGIVGSPSQQQQGGATNNYYLGSDEGSGDSPVPQMPAAEQSGDGGDGGDEVTGAARGGMIRKMAGGGSIEEGAGMSIDQAMSYGKSKEKEASASASPLSGVAKAIGAGAAKGALGEKEKPKTEAVTPRGPMGSGVAGSYTEADSQPGGVLDTGIYRSGGRVRQFQSGGRVMRAIDTGTSGPGSGYGHRAPPPGRST